MRASQHLSDELARHGEIGAELGAARYLVDAVRSIRAMADVLELGAWIFDFFLHGSRSSNLGGGVEHRAHNLVVAGAAAQIACQPITHFRLRRVRLSLEQRLGSDQEARRADAALQRCVLDELALQGMQLVAPRHALNGPDRIAVGLYAQHQAGAHQPAINRDAASTAVAGRAAFLGPGQSELVTQAVEQGFLRVAQELDGIAVDGGSYMVFGHQTFLARSSAMTAARRARTPATLMRYSLVPRLSSMGRQAALAAAASFCRACSSTLVPTSACAAGATSSGRSATAPSATRAAVHLPLLSSVRHTPQPTTAMSISVRGMKRR